jgi:site-specific DNA-methyltransferase (adenine-specific)
MYLWATAALRVLKPGGYLLAFGGTRTHHRLWCAIEDAGFEIRDTIMWVYGSGFPKSHNLKGEWHGFGTALKPAYEPICVARKPLDGTVAENVQKWGVGAMDIDGCRISLGGDSTERRATEYRDVAPVAGMNASKVRGSVNDNWRKGRWPANLIHDGSEEVLGLFPQTTTWQGERKGGYKGTSMFGLGGINDAPASSGSAARFFYCAKASRSERGADNKHPTVKPLALMRYLVNLVSRPGHIVLDPFMGSGTTGIACRELGREFIGIDNNAEYCQIAERRIAAGAQ